jgi:hypothetical protein
MNLTQRAQQLRFDLLPLVHIIRSSRTMTLDFIITYFSVDRVRTVLRRT